MASHAYRHRGPQIQAAESCLNSGPDGVSTVSQTKGAQVMEGADGERRLLAQAKGGDGEAFRELAEPYRRELLTHY